MTKVYITDKAVDGILRVIEAQKRYLPDFGVEIAHRPEDADVICTHGGTYLNVPGKPQVNVTHGLYWSRQNWGRDFQQVNSDVVEAMCQAVAHTAPSEWVAVAMRRGVLAYPEVVYHGVEVEKFRPAKSPKQYVLWNKGRTDQVSDPAPVNEVAKLLPQVQFLTTYGHDAPNVTVIGRVSYEEMQQYVSEAGVYLATTRETMGIGTLEALASGVPIAGFDWGGTSEIIKQGETGYLSSPYDYNGLARAITSALSQRERMSPLCVQDVHERWLWPDKIEQYAEIFKRVHKYHSKQRPKVSVVVTAHNLDKYLPECLDSVKEQTLEDFECIVVDDALSEDTKEIVLSYKEEDRRFKYVTPPHNLGLPGARNYGMRIARSLYIRHLDADDALNPTALEIEAGALDQDWGIHIAYGHLENMNEDGSPTEEGRLGWPWDEFDYRGQMSHIHQFPSCMMMRRSIYDRSGGYRPRQERAEDAHAACLWTSFGFRAKKVTKAVTMRHRLRGDSKGALEWKDGGDGDWTSWFPWRLGAKDFNEGKTVWRRTGKDYPGEQLVPFAAQGEPPPSRLSWHVHDYSYPQVSIIVTVGPGHDVYLMDALDSIQAQSYPDWEVVVVNDTGKEWGEYFKSPVCYPWAKVISTGGNKGASFARNLGAQHTKAPLMIWMDGDDYWLPWYLERMVAYAEANNGVIFSDLYQDKGEHIEEYQYKEFDCVTVPVKMGYAGSSVLVPRWVWERVVEHQGGWDEEIVGMEDWDFQIAMHHVGACAFRVPEPLFVYRLYSSTKRETDYDKIDQIVAYANEKWKQYRKEGEVMGCGGGCGGKTPKRVPTTRLHSSGVNMVQPESLGDDEFVLVEYFGDSLGSITYRSKTVRGQSYRFGLQPSHKVGYVYKSDWEAFFKLQQNSKQQPAFKIIDRDAPQTMTVEQVTGR